MTETQQYRVVADRDKGDDPHINYAQDGDLLAFRKGREFEPDYLVRIERPVPTEHCLSTAQHDGHEWAAHEGQPGTGYWCPGFDAAEDHPPTREQIAEVMQRADQTARWGENRYEVQADAVLALFQNGADR
ncbi:hypothetical protein [Curtobacterium sp. MCLR17_034]|uniref:hypothetical protein n=1 Tax=Curtobacterium sp. MCLR17_034 TaxID=2175623 RepID=UPI000DAA2C34|nr:hypothetical protein [Curtobacterium sp. MCLR17_034]PZF11782.1 hypothetical protein DEI98_06585 [Curtobacterium sp. MCLR17_034]